MSNNQPSITPEESLRLAVTKLFLTWHAEVSGETNVNFVPDMQVENLITETVALIETEKQEAYRQGQMDILRGVKECFKDLQNDEEAVYIEPNYIDPLLAELTTEQERP